MLAEMGDVTPQEAARRLAEAGVPDPQRDARRLWDWALRKAEARHHHPSAPFAPPSTSARRGCRSPASPGRRAFWKHEFAISDAVLDPRPIPKRWWRSRWARPFDTVLDLGTGSGCILLSLLAERPGARGLGTDISEAALEIARQNAARLGIEGRHSCAPTGSRVEGAST
jgi:release factor glutamine methyltransferase